MELLTVIALMAILTRAVVATPGDHLAVARHVQLTARARELDLACAAYQRSHGRWPERVSQLTGAGLVAAVTPCLETLQPPEWDPQEPGPQAGEEALLLVPSAAGRRDLCGAMVVDAEVWRAARPPGGWGW